MEAWMKDNEFYLWLMSFIIAFMLVKYGGEIIAGLGSGIKGMASLIGLFL